MILTHIFSLFFFSFTTYCLAPVSSNVDPYNSSTSKPPSSTSNTTISPSALTIRYWASSPSLRRRQNLASTPINNCRSPTATFVHSHCLHSPDMIGSLQSYLVFCRDSSSHQGTRIQSSGNKPPVAPPAASRAPRPTAESGRCGQNEVCVNGQVPGGWGTSMAWCVRKDRFSGMTEAVADGLRRNFFKDRMGREMGKAMASAVVSDDEGMTPVKVQEMELAFGKEGGENGGLAANDSASSAFLKTRTCLDCFEMITPDFAPKTNWLTADVRVFGTAAATGILWLAVLSG